MLLRSIKNNNSGVSSLGRWGYTRYQGSYHYHWRGGTIQDTRGLHSIQDTRESLGRWGYTRYQGSYHRGGGAIQDTRGLITGEVGLYKIPGVLSLARWGTIQDTRGLITGEMGLYKIPVVLSLGRWGYTRYQGNHKLCIESGRHRRPVLPREERICAVCKNNEIEDEAHMLFSCTLYNTLREQFLIKQQHILNTAFDNYDYWLNILFTTENKASIRTTARYISQCFLLRDAASSN